MFFEIGQNKVDPWFSWMIAKNPKTPYNRVSKNKANVLAGATHDKKGFSGIIFRGSSEFLNKARDLNLPTYVNLQRDSVCPLNLNVFYEVFRSSIRGDFKIENEDIALISGLDDIEGVLNEQINLKRDMYAVMGPFSFIQEEEIERMQLFYSAFGLKSTVIKQDGLDNVFFLDLRRMKL